MSGLKNSPFGKRLRASQQDTTEEEGHRRNRPRVNPIFGLPLSLSSTPALTANSATSDSSNGPDSPVDEPPPSPSRGQRKDSKREYYGDRFVPSRDAGDMRTSYHLMGDAGPSTPSKSRIIPSESDALKEQANSIFNSILHTEVTPPSPHRPSSPARAPPSMAPPTTPTRKRLFAYSSPSSRPTTPSTSRVLDSPNSSAYSMSPVRTESRDLLLSPRRQLRSVCKTPYRVLDAPELADDFYLNLVDWSSTNVLGVGLGSCVYLWTAHNAAVNKLCDLAPQGDTVSSVSWVQHGTSLAIGTLSGRLHIYDASTLGLLRTYQNAHSQRIGALAWNSHILSSGSRDRMVHHRDVRIQDQRPFRKCAGHKQEVCGLKWSGDGSGGSASSGSMGAASANLASGGNDNKVCIWDLRGSRRSGGTSSRSTGSSVSSLNMNTATFNPTSIIITPGVLSAGTSVNSNYPTNTDEGMSSGDIAPLWKFHEHTAAVKALAWDPHVNGVLATGGGTQDKHIRFWNVGHGTMLSELDTGSQVCNLIWSLTSHELVSTHGFSSTTAQNQICIWKYPTLNMVASLTGHTNRVLYLAMSPDGETIVTGAGDETLRFWNAFPKTSGGRGTSYGTPGREEKPGSQLDYGKLIR